MDEFALEAALFNKPGRADLNTIVTTVNGMAFGLGDFGVRLRKINVFKERTRAGFGGRIREFVCTNDGNDVTDAGWASVSKIMVGDVSFDGIIKWARHLARMEL